MGNFRISIIFYRLKQHSSTSGFKSFSPKAQPKVNSHSPVSQMSYSDTIMRHGCHSLHRDVCLS